MSRHNFSVKFYLNFIYLGQKKSLKVPIVRFLNVPVKFTKFLMSFINHKLFFLQSLHQSSV